MKDFGFALLTGVFGLGAVFALTIAPDPGSGRVAAVFAPWTSAETAFNTVVRHDVPIVRSGWGNRIVIVDITDRPALRDALAADALFLADPRIAGACITRSTT